MDQPKLSYLNPYRPPCHPKILTTLPNQKQSAQHMQQPSIAHQAFEQYATYKEPALTHRRFRHADLEPLLEQLSQSDIFEVKKAGHSVEQRAIYQVKAGSGKTSVMLWSQMHGDEATATMALFDLFRFLQQSGDALDPVRRRILEQTTLYMVPMLNPDGAEQFKRRNALEIDLNRDALRLQSPEARLLKHLRDTLQPDFGFNLHDQSRYYTVGDTPMPATISFLAPPFDASRSINPVRERAMRTIAGLNHQLQQLIPGQVAKYSDEFEPRAFGDNIQKWGTSVILIESGGYANDAEKQFIRQLNFAALVSALHHIADGSYASQPLEAYHHIPENTKNLFDLVIRDVAYPTNGHTSRLDLGIYRNEVNCATPIGFYHSSTIEEIGDMSIYHGYEELDAKGLLLVPGKVYPEPFQSMAQLSEASIETLLAEGYTTVRLTQLPDTLHNPCELPLNITGLSTDPDHNLKFGGSANFSLQDETGKVYFTIVNGFVHSCTQQRPALLHGLVH
ncbi:peptidase M14 [Pontibacter oryzae]|uniref:Peptidase M14 n=2 Tax=Pontibacter oryzae TaxID=2304593 RepID=A0A399RW23_9BACT|nr:peptidase M14 [Pontibacter oryzae]